MGQEAVARKNIDRMLRESGWLIQDYPDLDLGAELGVAVREYPIGRDAADYALFIDRKPVGVVEAKKEGYSLIGVTEQSDRYLRGLHEKFPNAPRPPPFSYETTGIETLFADRRDPKHRSRHVFTFHRPRVLARWLQTAVTLRKRLTEMPRLDYGNLRRCQYEAIVNLERSFAENRQRALIQMATGSGKTFTATTFIYRLLKFAGARKILFLVDRANLGRQALKEFQNYSTPDDGRALTSLYNVRHLTSQTVGGESVVISTIQRLYSILQGKDEFSEDNDEFSGFELGDDGAEVEIRYNPSIPISEFDFIVIDECHRSIYNKWKQVLDYFDSFLIGLTATPSKHTLGFFENNEVTAYPHERAVADGVNVTYHVYRINTKLGTEGNTIEAGEVVETRNRMTRARRRETLDDDVIWKPGDLDRSVVAPDQIRLVIRTFRDRLHEIFPGRERVPKTLVFAKDDSHAEDITKIIREVFGEGNEFCQKITYKTTGDKPENIIRNFRNSKNPRIAVSVDMIATGTDIKPLECIIFMRDVKSQLYFDQMKGRGTRVIEPDDLMAVTPDAKSKDHFVIVDAVGVCEHAKTDTHSLNRKKGVPLKDLMQEAAEGRGNEDTLKSLAYRISRLNGNLDDNGRQEIESVANMSVSDMINRLVDGTDADKHMELAKEKYGTEDPNQTQIDEAAAESVMAACKMFDSAKLRQTILDVKRQNHMIIDETIDELVEAGFDRQAKRPSDAKITSFEEFVENNKDELAALSIIYSKPYNIRKLTFNDIRELANAIEKPPYNLTPAEIWDAYTKLGKARAQDNPERMLTDLISIVRFSTGQSDKLTPFKEVVDEKFAKWIETQESGGRRFTQEQKDWLVMIKSHIASSISITPEDLDGGRFFMRGGRVKMRKVFGDGYESMLSELQEALITNE